MSKPLRRSAVVAAAAALALSLSGCVGPGWVYGAPPAAGTQTDADGLKLRNFLIIAADNGDAMLVGAITARDAAASVVGIGYAPELSDGSFGSAQAIELSEDIRQGQTVYLDGSTTQFSNPELLVGRLALVRVAFASGTVAELEVPVMSSEHEDFVQAWADAHA